MAGAIDALVPMKGLGRAKARLATLLTPAQRSALAGAMLQDVLKALARTPKLRRVHVVTGDAAVAALVKQHGAVPLAEPANDGGLNAALEWARIRLLADAGPPDELLVVPADVPAITSGSVARLLEGGGVRSFVRLCPSRDGGTNALFLRPPEVIPFRFGRGSAREHEAEAAAAGVPFEPRTIAPDFDDIDTVDDVKRFLEVADAGYTRAALLDWGIDATWADPDREWR
jgi:2-phospho-L-lactate guanylyltransferase